jgi:hypothetical protein
VLVVVLLAIQAVVAVQVVTKHLQRYLLEVLLLSQ